MDLTETIIPKSDQLNAEDMLTGPRTFTIAEVRAGSSEQPVNIFLAEFPGRPFRPSKTVRRILVAAWGKDSDAYVGRRFTLYRDEKVRWAGEEVGGIRVQAMSHIDKPMKLALAVSKSKRESYVVQPLADAPPTPQGADAGQLRAINDGLLSLGITDGPTKLATVGQVIDREITHPNQLTPIEAATVLDWITHEQQADSTPAEPTLDGLS